MREKIMKCTLLFLVLVFALQCLTLRCVRATYHEVRSQMSVQAPYMEAHSITVIQVLDLVKERKKGAKMP